MAKLFAFDSMSVLYRGYFAMIRNPLINSKGLNTSGIRTVLMQLVKIIEDEKPDYLAVASDAPDETFRHQMYPEYKATREKMPEDLVEQLPYLPRAVEALNLPFLILPGYEADDIIGTLIRQCHEHGIEGVMVTSDKDYMQLISDTSVMLNHRNEIIGVKDVHERFGCAPEQVIQVLGLMGDSSDNIPGVRGVGEKTATKLIQQFGSIEKLYQHLEEVPGKSLKTKLEAGREQAFLAKELVTIHCEAPIKATMEDLHLGEVDLYKNSAFHAVLEELELNTLLRRLTADKTASAAGNGLNNESQTNKEPKKVRSKPVQLNLIREEDERKVLKIEWEELKSIAECERFLSSCPANEPIGLSMNYTGSHQLDYQPSGLALSVGPETAVYIRFNESNGYNQIPKSWIAGFFEDSTRLKVVHDLKKTTHLLFAEGISPRGIVGDVMLSAHLADPLSRHYDLDFLLGRRLNLNRGDAEAAPPLRTCEDACVTLRLHHLFEPQLEQADMSAVLHNVELPLAHTLARLEHTGIMVDVETLRNIGLELVKRLETLRDQARRLAGMEFNPNSVVDLQDVLYVKHKLHERFRVKPKKIKLGNKMSTDEETLEKLTEDPLPRTILEYRELNKLNNTYVDQLPTFVHPVSGRIHSTFQQSSTATGRLSSENPNLQNIPVRSPEGRRVRRAFVPSQPRRLLISADYSQIELRIVAHYSKDPTFLEAYRKNLDIHALTASTIFKVTQDQVTREMRSRAKEVNFGLIYRMGPERLSIVTQTSKAEAKEFIERYFEKYSTIHALQERFIEQARKEGYALTLLGRRRYLPDILGKGLLKRMAEGAAVNTPIQGSAAEIIKLAMIEIDRRIQREKLQSRMVLTVHDELVFDALAEEEGPLCSMIKEVMENVVTLEVPLVVEIGTGPNWLDAH